MCQSPASYSERLNTPILATMDCTGPTLQSILASSLRSFSLAKER